MCMCEKLIGDCCKKFIFIFYNFLNFCKNLKYLFFFIGIEYNKILVFDNNFYYYF